MENLMPNLFQILNFPNDQLYLRIIIILIFNSQLFFFLFFILSIANVEFP
jgi:hypothetical protein